MSDEKSNKNYLYYLGCVIVGSLLGWCISKRMGMAFTGKFISNLGNAAGTLDSSIKHTEQGLDILIKYLR